MTAINTERNVTLWVPFSISSTVQATSPDSSKPVIVYTWKYKGQVKQKSTKNGYEFPTINESDATGWSVTLTAHSADDKNFTGDSVDVGTENFTFKLMANPYVESFEIPTSFNVGDTLRAKVVYRIEIPQNISTDFYKGDGDAGLLSSIDGDNGFDHHVIQIAKFAWPEFSGKYRVEMSDENGQVKFRQPFTAQIEQSRTVFNAQLNAPAYFKITEDAPNEPEFTIVRYRLERSDGTLMYESRNSTLFVTRSATPQDAGDYVACIRAYKSVNGQENGEYREGTRFRFKVNVKENEFFDGGFDTMTFRYPSGSSTTLTMTPKMPETGWLLKPSMIGKNIYFTWFLGGAVFQSKPYGENGYDRITLDNLQYDMSVSLQLSVAPIDPKDPAKLPTGRPLFFSRRSLDIYDKEYDMRGIEIGSPIVLKIVDPEPPAPTNGQTRALAIYKNDVLVEEIPIESKEYKVTDSADREHNAVYSHAYIDKPSHNQFSAHLDYDIAGRATYRVEVVPNMEFTGPEHVMVEEGQPFELRATMINQPSTYVPRYQFSKAGVVLPITDSSIPVYKKERAEKSDTGVYKFVAFADTNGNNSLDGGEIVGYTKYVHVVVTDRKPPDADPKPARLVTKFHVFSKGRFSPCPFWVIDELKTLMDDPHRWNEMIANSRYYDWQITIFNEFLKGRNIYLQDSCHGYWAIIRQHDLSLETGYGRFKHYPGRNP